MQPAGDGQVKRRRAPLGRATPQYSVSYLITPEPQRRLGGQEGLRQRFPLETAPVNAPSVHLASEADGMG